MFEIRKRHDNMENPQEEKVDLCLITRKTHMKIKGYLESYTSREHQKILTLDLTPTAILLFTI